MKSARFVLLFLLLCAQNIYCLTICTAANAFYFQPLLNFIGSLHKVNFDDLHTLMVYDLGLTEEQLNYLSLIDKLEVHKVREVHPDILKPVMVFPNGKTVPGWYAWKPVVIKQSLEKVPAVLWIDAGLHHLKAAYSSLQICRAKRLLSFVQSEKMFPTRVPIDIKYRLANDKLRAPEISF